MFHVASVCPVPAARPSALGSKVELFQGVSLSRCRPFLRKFGSYLDRAYNQSSAQREWPPAGQPFDPSDIHLGLRLVASHLIGIDTTGNFRGPSNQYWTLYVRVILDQCFAGVCAELLEDVLTYHELVISDFIAEELGRKIRDKFNFPESEVRQLRRFLARMASAAVPADLPANVCHGSEDVPVLGTAVAAAASVLVTVEKDLHVLGEFQGIAIIKPGEFWQKTT
jgi:predicted nucleic acid-binding protein